MGTQAPRIAVMAAALLMTACNTTPQRLGHGLMHAGSPNTIVIDAHTLPHTFPHVAPHTLPHVLPHTGMTVCYGGTCYP